MQRDSRDAECSEVYDLRALTAIEMGTAVRQYVAESLVNQYPAPAEIPLELRDLLMRLSTA
jgi:hypothetical protein